MRDPLRGITRDFRSWSRLRVDTQFQADLRLLCQRAIPAAAAAALASCTAQGSDTASGAAARYAFVRSSGRPLFDADPNAAGIQRAGPRASN